MDIKILEQYQRCINAIDDFLEYRYQSYSKEKMRDKILDEFNILQSELEKIMDNWRKECQ